MRFLADENFPFLAIAPLRGYGYDVLLITEGHAGASDEMVAALCDQQDRILLTFDKDFGELIFRRGLSASLSVVLFRIAPDPSTVAETIHSLML